MKNEEKNVSLTEIISTAIQIPGVRIDRELFLREQFKGVKREQIEEIVDKGPIKANCSREELKRKAMKLINSRTLTSTGASFVAGMPGGFAIAATIPADIMQFYSVALRMAQELAYLYGEDDLWDEGVLDKDKVTNQLILYCGVMFGVSGATQTIKVLCSSLSKQALKKLPQKALTKTIYYPIIKSIVKFFGGKMTKDVFAKGVSKTIPVVGGIVSGGLTFATMKPMGKRLADAFDEAYFSYTQKEFEKDWKDIIEVCEEDNIIDVPKFVEVVAQEPSNEKGKNIEFSDLEKIKQTKELLDAGIITEEEFEEITKKSMEERAIENGILDKAFENAKQIIEKLVNSDIVQEQGYSIKFKTLK